MVGPALAPMALRNARAGSTAFPQAAMLTPGQTSLLDTLLNIGPGARTSLGLGGRIPSLGGPGAFSLPNPNVLNLTTAANTAESALPSVARGAVPYVDDVGNILGSGATRAAGGAGAGSAALPTAAGMIPKGAALRGGLYGVAGMAGSGIIDRFDIGGQNSNIEQGLQGAAQGAGIGAGLGLLGGPFAPLSVPTGAAVGGVLGGLGGIAANFFGGNSKKNAEKKAEEELADQLNSFSGLLDTYVGNDTATRQYFATQLQFNTDLINSSDSDDKFKTEQKLQLLAGLQQQLGQYVAQGGSQQQQQPSLSATDILYMQQKMGEFIEPIAADMEASGQATQEMFGSKGREIGGPDGRYLELRGLAQGHGATSLANAYRMQAQLIPAMYQLNLAKQYNPQAPYGYGQYANTGSQVAQQGQGQETDPSMDALLQQLSSSDN